MDMIHEGNRYTPGYDAPHGGAAAAATSADGRGDGRGGTSGEAPGGGTAADLQGVRRRWIRPLPGLLLPVSFELGALAGCLFRWPMFISLAHLQTALFPIS